jgi:hypothetical protein
MVDCEYGDRYIDKPKIYGAGLLSSIAAYGV